MDWWRQWDFGIIRVHNGYREDFMWRDHLAEAEAAGVQVGFYGYAVGDSALTPAQQAEQFVALVGDSTAPVSLWGDYEDPSLTRDAAQAHLARLVELHSNAGVYANAGDYNRFLAGSVADVLHFWIAGYGPNDGQQHPLNPPAPRGWVIHQFTSRGGPNGSGLDVNYSDNLDSIGGNMALTQADAELVAGEVARWFTGQRQDLNDAGLNNGGGLYNALGALIPSPEDVAAAVDVKIEASFRHDALEDAARAVETASVGNRTTRATLAALIRKLEV